MTEYVSDIGPTFEGNLPIYWNNVDDLSLYDIQTNYFWLRSLNTQVWLGPYSYVDGTAFINDRYAKWEIELGNAFAESHKNGYYQMVMSLPIGTDKPVAVGKVQNVIKIICKPGGDTNTKPYISNNEDREADTYFRPNY